jgi:hypothetical protein
MKSTIERIYVDFNTMMQDQQERVRIHQRRVQPCFRIGMHVIIHDETLEVDALLEFDETRRIWWARPDWSTSRDLRES